LKMNKRLKRVIRYFAVEFQFKLVLVGF
jgi:hypothetical protein